MHWSFLKVKWVLLPIIFFSIASFLFFSQEAPQMGIASSQSNISSSTGERFAWNDVSGWWDFFAHNGTANAVIVDGLKVKGSASSSVGYVSLDCETSPNGNICGTSDYGICNGPGPHSTICPNGDGSGVLTGYAWNDQIGWISFNCSNTGTCGTSNYKAQINTSSGIFSGWAWNDIVGWISFNCANNGSCGSSSYEVKTSWANNPKTGVLESVILDTQVDGGAVLNSIIWQGSLPAGTCVKFQLALSNASSGPWNYEGPTGTVSYYGDSPSCVSGGTPIPVNLTIGSYRYFRYKIFLESNNAQTLSPNVEDVILNWSQ